MQKLYWILFLFATSAAFAQNQAEEVPPRVGLVLSGGGAKGMAHIGALKVIEEAGVKIDYIGGTSMGAIVGAFYAAGYSAHTLDSLFVTTDFTNLIQDYLPRDAKTFYEKEDSERYALTLPFNNFKITFPSAISGGQNIYNELVRLLYHVKDIDDFSNLPTPFFCIGTNIETGAEVFLNKGYLPEAIMASGSFPSLFVPAEFEGEILIDGGVLNNYPVEEIRKMGAEIVIGVDVQHGLRDRADLGSATEILLQINNFRTVREMKEKMELTDIYIKPDMQKYSVLDFDLNEEIIETGETAARDHFSALQEIAKTQGEKLVEKAPIKIMDSLVINQITIPEDLGYSQGYIKGKLRVKMGERVAFSKLRQGISNLAATGNFQTIRYKLSSGGSGEDLILNLKEDPNDTYLRVGAHYDELYKSAALLNLTKKRLLVKNDVASIDVILGDNLRYNLQYYVDKGLYWSVGINSRYNDFNKEINYDIIRQNFDAPEDPNINNINLQVEDFTNQFYLQTVLQEEFAFRIGIEQKLLRYSTTTLNEEGTQTAPLPPSDDATFFEKSNYYSTYGTLTLDTYDDKYYPTRGFLFDGDFHLYLLSSDFNNNFKEFSIGKARMGFAIPFSDKWSFNFETEGGFKLGISRITSFDFILGGYGNQLINNFIPFFGYDFISLPGNSYVKAYGRLDFEFAQNNHLLLAANMGNVEDDIFRTGEWFTEPDYTGFALGYGMESFLGPMQVFYSWSPQLDKGQFFFSIGYWF